jgi:hypothetical protein
MPRTSCRRLAVAQTDANDLSGLSTPSFTALRKVHSPLMLKCRSLRHGVLLVFGAPSQLGLLVRQEHNRTIPSADMRRTASPGSLI